MKEGSSIVNPLLREEKKYESKDHSKTVLEMAEAVSESHVFQEL